MHCSARTTRPSPEGSRAQVARSASDRVGDLDREDTAALLRRGFADGLLDVAELDTSLEAAYRARTAGELDTAVAALPSDWVAATLRADAAEARARARQRAWRAQVRTYLLVMALLTAIWALGAAGDGGWHPWPLWPALGWGLPLWFGRPRPPGAAENFRNVPRGARTMG
jgi:sirohydrochlorin ferrochelatase